MSFGNKSKAVLGQFLQRLLINVREAKVRILVNRSRWGRSDDLLFMRFYIMNNNGVEILVSASEDLYFENRYYWHNRHLLIITKDNILFDRVMDPPILWQKSLSWNIDNPEYLIAQIFDECLRQDKERHFETFKDLYDSELNKRLRVIREREDQELEEKFRRTFNISQE